MILYGLQHVLVMYAGAVAVPLVVGNAVGLPAEHIILLISADLFICGAATIVQIDGHQAVAGLPPTADPGLYFRRADPDGAYW